MTMGAARAAVDGQASPHNTLEAARLNGIGVALMNQQLTEKAAAKLAEAHAADPASAIPVLNRGIALLYEQKLPEAEQELRAAAKMAPENPRTWYNLGLTEMDEANQKAAIEDMRKVLAIDPNDADAHYFVGSLDLSLGNFDEAIAEFEAALQAESGACFGAVWAGAGTAADGEDGRGARASEGVPAFDAGEAVVAAERGVWGARAVFNDAGDDGAGGAGGGDDPGKV